jgi:hypothetical protein
MESCNFEAIEISLCPMGSGIIETEESAAGTILRSILRTLFIEIGQDCFNKELMIECLLW